MPYPTINDNPALGLTESVHDATGQDVVDERTTERGYPFITPEENLPEDDAHRLNHLAKMADEDMGAVELASLLDIPAYMLLPNRSS